MATITVTTAANIDSITGRQGSDVYNIQGTSASLTVDEDSRYGKYSTPYSGPMNTITPSSTLGGSLFLDGRNVRLIPYNSGSGSVPPNGTTVSKGGASGTLIGVYSALNVAPSIPADAMPSTGYIKIKAWNGTAFTSGALTIGATSTTQILPAAISDFEGLLAATDMTVTAGTAVISNSATFAHGGSKSLRIAPSATTTVAVQTAAANRPRIGAGVTLTVTGYGRGSDTKTQTLSVDWYDSSMGFLSTSTVQSQSVASGSFVTFTNTVTSPASTAYMGINIGVTTPTSGQFYYWDDITATYAGFSTGATATGADTVGWIEPVGVDGMLILFSGPNQTLNSDFSMCKGDWYEIGTTDGSRSTSYQIPTNGAASYHGGVMVDVAAATSISAATWSAGVATITSTSHGLAALAGAKSGKVRVFVDGVVPYAYKGSYEATIIDANTFTVPITTNPGSYSSGGTVAATEWYPCTPEVNTKFGTEADRGKFCWIASSTGLLRFGNDATTSTGGYIPATGLKIRIPNVFTAVTASGGATPQTNAPPNSAVASRCRFYGGQTGSVVVSEMSGTWSPSVLQFSKTVSLTNCSFLNNIKVTTNFTPCSIINVCVGSGASTTSGNALNIVSHLYGMTVMDSVFTQDMTANGNFVVSLGTARNTTMTRCKLLGTGDRVASTWAWSLNIGSGLTAQDITISNCGIVTTSQFSDVSIKGITYSGSAYGRVSATALQGNITITNVSNNYLIDTITVPQAAPHNIMKIHFLSVSANCANVTVRNVGTYASPISTGAGNFQDLAWSRVTTLATVTQTAHGYTTSDRFYVTTANDGAGAYAGAAIPAGIKVITVTDADHFTFACTNAGPTSGNLDGYLAGLSSAFLLAGSSRNVTLQNINLRQLYTGPNNSGNDSNSGVTLQNCTFDTNMYTAAFADDRLSNDLINASGQMSPYIYTVAGTAVFGAHFIDCFYRPTATPGASSLVTGAAWTRSTTTATVTSTGHGLNHLDLIQVWDSSSVAAITNGLKLATVINVDKNTFTFTCLNAGSASGTLSYRCAGDSTYMISMTEPTSTSLPYVTTSGGAKFTGAGTLVAFSVSDQVIWEQPYFMKGYNTFTKFQPLCYASGLTTTNFDLYYDTDRGSGFAGSYNNLAFNRSGASGSAAATTFTVTNATGVNVGDYAWGTGIGADAKVTNVNTGTNTITVDVANSGTVSGVITFGYAPNESTFPSTGIKLRVKLVTNTANATAMGTITIPMNSDATSRARLYDQTTAVTLAVQALDSSLAPIQNARVYIKAAAGGPLTTGTLIYTALTDASGNISTSFGYSTADQPITGWVRKSTSPSLYKQATIAGTITTSGYSSTAILAADS